MSMMSRSNSWINWLSAADAAALWRRFIWRHLRDLKSWLLEEDVWVNNISFFPCAPCISPRPSFGWGKSDHQIGKLRVYIIPRLTGIITRKMSTCAIFTAWIWSTTRNLHMIIPLTFIIPTNLTIQKHLNKPRSCIEKIDLTYSQCKVSGLFAVEKKFGLAFLWTGFIK